MSLVSNFPSEEKIWDGNRAQLFNSIHCCVSTFLGPRGPLVLPLVELRTRYKNLDTYIQAYMPYESSEVLSNQPDGTKESHRCPLDPLGPCRPTP